MTILNAGSRSPRETKEIGKKLGSFLKAGDVVAFSGQLGAGKTTFISGLAAGLEIVEPITSPSFVIIREYAGRLSLFHLDLYRLEPGPEVLDLGLEEYFEKNGVVAVEWAEKLAKLLPAKRINVRIEIISQNERKIRIEGDLDENFRHQ